MRRIQFYPGENLEKKLETNAKTLGVSVSALVVDILNQHFSLKMDDVPLTELTQMVMHEVEEHIASLEPKAEFTLESASETFRNIDMVAAGGKISAIRANIGKSFARKVGHDTFKHIAIAYKESGKPKKNINNASVYVKNM